MSKMKIKWLRGSEELKYNRPFTYESLGIRDSGKSSLTEHIGQKFLDGGNNILDLFGSKDGEGLAWLRSEYVEDRKVLLTHGENVIVESEHDMKTVDDLKMGDFENYGIIISANLLYHNSDEEFMEAAHITDKIYTRNSWDNLTYGIVREAANLYFSRLKVSDTQTQAKAAMIYMIREARHIGLALGLDTIRFYALDIDIRSLADYLFIKRMGMYGLPKDLTFLYSFVDPLTLRRLPRDKFVAVSQPGSIGLGAFSEVKWHKQEKENILKNVGIDVRYEEPVDRGVDKGTFTTLGDKEHKRLIELYVDKELSQAKIADRMKRSRATIFNHLREHNESVERVGYCQRCKRTKGEYADTSTKRGA